MYDSPQNNFQIDCTMSSFSLDLPGAHSKTEQRGPAPDLKLPVQALCAVFTEAGCNGPVLALAEAECGPTQAVLGRSSTDKPQHSGCKSKITIFSSGLKIAYCFE